MGAGVVLAQGGLVLVLSEGIFLFCEINGGKTPFNQFNSNSLKPKKSLTLQ